MGAVAAEAAALADLAEEFIAKRVVEGKSPQTQRVYRFWLTHPVTDRHVGGLAAHVPDVESFDSRAIRRYFTILKDRGMKTSTIHQGFRTIRAFVRWLQKPEIVGPLPHGNPLVDFRPATPKTLPRVPKPEEVQGILDACGDGLVGWRDRAMIVMMADSLLRRQEVLNLRVCDWNRGDRATLPSFNVIRGKGSKDRNVSCGEQTAAALRRYLSLREKYSLADPLIATRSGERLTGRGMAQVLHRLSGAAGLPRERRHHPHGLRHFGATNWHKAGIDLETIRLQLGHESILTTQRYLHLMADDIARAHAKASPLERAGISIKKKG